MNSESAEKYNEDMSRLALFVGIKEEDLTKDMIRGLPPNLRWHVVSFNPTTLSETIEIIMLGEYTLLFTEEIHEINEISDSFAVLCTKLEERVRRLEDLNNNAPTNEKPKYQDPPPLALGMEGDAILQPSVFDLEHMRR